MKTYTKWFVIEKDATGCVIFYPKANYYSEEFDKFVHNYLGCIRNDLQETKLELHFVENSNGLMSRYQKYLKNRKLKLDKEEKIMNILLGSRA